MAKRRPSKNDMQLGIVAYLTTMEVLSAAETDDDVWKARLQVSKDILGGVTEGLLQDFIKHFGAEAAKEEFGYEQA